MILAAITAVGVFIGSHHEPHHEGYCEQNPGILVEEGAWHYGVYRNSLCRAAPFVHRYWELASNDGLKIGVSAGPTGGYAFPFTAWFRVTYGVATLYVVPPVVPITGVKPPVLGLALRWELN